MFKSVKIFVVLIILLVSAKGACAAMTPQQALVDYFLSRPFISSEHVRARRSYGFSQDDIISKEGDNVEQGKTMGLPINLPGDQDITVVAAVTRFVLGAIDYGSIPADFEKNRSLTFSLIHPNGVVFRTLKANGNDVAFQLESMYVDEGEWRVRIDEATGYHDEQVFLVMAVKGLRNIDGVPSTNIYRPSRNSQEQRKTEAKTNAIPTANTSNVQPNKTTASGAMSDSDFIELCKKGTLQQINEAITKNGANVNAKNVADMTALMWAVESNSNTEATTALIKAGANVNAKTKDEWTPLMWAVRSKNSKIETITALINAGADVNAKSKDGMTPLIFAVRNNSNPNVIITLLSFKADPKVRDNSGKMAIDYAKANKALENTDVLRELEKSGYR